MNRSTRGQWEMYGSHRQQIERLIVPPQPGGRACVLGAGNCNDLDLKWMMQVYREVHLVDLDADALAQGVRRQKCEDRGKLRLHAPLDLSGAGDLISQWSKSAPDDTQIDECLRRFDAPSSLAQIHLPARSADNDAIFDLVLSPCVLSQLLICVRDAIGSSHPRYPQLRSGLRQRHLRMMCNLLAPGGQGALAIDLASSEDFPELAGVPDDQAADLMRTLVEKRKCFAALAPAELLQAIQPLVKRGLAGNIRSTRPWLWHLGLRKSFLVYGMLFRKPG